MNRSPAAIRAAVVREMLRERFPAAHAVPPASPTFAMGVRLLDQFGIRRGSITEIVSDSSLAGSGVLLSAVLDQAIPEQRFIALIDAADAFDPQSHPVSNRFLLVRCRKIEEALRAADLLLRDGNLPFVVIDFQLCARQLLSRVPASSWSRLSLLAEKSGVTCLAFTPSTTISCASLRLLMNTAPGSEIFHLSRQELIARLHLRQDRMRAGILSTASEPLRTQPVDTSAVLPATAFSVLDGASAETSHSLIHVIPLRKAG